MSNSNASIVSAPDPTVFLGGCPRSGTTLIQRMLDHHSQLAIASDTHFVPRALEMVDTSLLQDAASGREIPLTEELVDAVRNYHRFYRMGLDEAQFEAALNRSTHYRRLVAELFAEFTSLRGKTLGGEKTPDYVRHIPALLGMFPGSKFIHIVRDGRNTALSLTQWADKGKGPGRLALWDEDPIAVSALWWCSFVTQSVDPKLANRIYVVHYEQLVADPTVALQEVVDFLGLDFESAMVRFHEGKQEIARTGSAKRQWLPAVAGLRNWQTDMADEDVAVFDALAGPALLRYHYDLASPKTSVAAQRRVDRALEWWNSPGRKRRAKTITPVSRKASHRTKRVSSPGGDDAELFVADAILDNLETLLVHERFRELCARNEINASDVGAGYVRYKQKTNCLVAYSNQDGTPFGYAVAYANDSLDKLKKLELFFREWPGFVDRESRIAFFPYPFDTRMPQLSEFVNPDSRFIRREFPALPQGDGSLSFRSLSFKPNRRSVVRIETEGKPLGVMRTFLPDDFLRAKRASKYLPSTTWNRSQRLGQSDRMASLLLSWVDGVPLESCLTETVADRVGKLLADIHKAPNPKLPVDDIPSRLATIERNVEAIGELIPTIVPRAERLANFLKAHLASSPHHLTLSHGDFHAGQIVEHQGELTVVDWDNAKNASPGFDLGSFAAHALYTCVTTGDSPNESVDAALTAIRSMATAYDCASRNSRFRPVTEELNAYVAGGIVNVATRPFRTRVSNWRSCCERLIEIAEQLVIPSSRRTSQSRLQNAVSVAAGHRLSLKVPLGDEDWLHAALSAQCVNRLLTPLLCSEIRDDVIELSEIQILGHKPGRRCAVRYSFEGVNGETSCVAKVRAKGVDVVAADVQLRLHDLVRQREPSLLRIARPLGSLAENNMWLQSYFSGPTVEEILVPDGDPQLSFHVGAALGELHELNVPVQRDHSFADEFAILENNLVSSANKRKNFADRIQNIQRECASLLQFNHAIGWEDREAWTGIHRDFHPAQAICNKDQIAIIDLDLFSRGHPAIDIGNFLAHLKELALRQYGDGHAMVHHESAFVAGYHSIRPLDPELIHRITIVSLARHIFISRRIPCRKHTTKSVIGLCESLIQQHKRQFQNIVR